MRRAAGFGTRVDTALLGLCILVALILKASNDPVRDGLASVLRNTVLAPLFSMQATTEKWRAALNSYDELVEARDSALLIALDVPRLEAENERLTRLMLLGSRLRWGSIPARVLHDASPGVHTQVTLAAGSDAGIKVSAPVVSTDGLVGLVRSVDRNTSVVLLWTDKDFAVSAMSDDGKSFGIVQARAGPGSGGYMLELLNVQQRNTLRPGSRVVTAGVGGVYPPMIPIGTVVDTTDSGNGWSRSYPVRPAVRPQDLSSVLVLDPERAKQGVRDVWPTQAQVDSITRLRLSKGDSVAQALYRAEQKALTDSALARLRVNGLPRDTSGPPKPGTVPPPVSASR